MEPVFSAFCRSLKDDFQKPLATWSCPRDPQPQWCHLAWNSDATLLAMADSFGTVSVFDIMGTPVCTVNKVCPHVTSFMKVLCFSCQHLAVHLL